MDFLKNAGKSVKNFFLRLGRWGKRGIIGEELPENVSPRRLFVKTLLKKKSVVIAAFVLIALFLFVFLAPLVVPLDLNYTDPLQQNVPPS